MHSATQIIAQRAPPATRMKARWQPYAIQSSSASSSSAVRSPYMNTPHASVSSPLPTQISSCNINRTHQPLPTPTTQTPKDIPPRDSTKHKFAAGLIDQAVNTLSEIWRPQDIPRVFQAPTKGANIQSTSQSHPDSHSKSIPPPPLSTQPPPTPVLLATGTDPDENLLPTKTFVHEVLRRSRTSGSILQAALCYLEAIRTKVPDLLHQENMGIRAHYQPDSRIQPATVEELEREVELCKTEDSFNTQFFDDSMKTIRVIDCGPEDLESDYGSVSSLVAEPSVASKPSTPSTPSLPSPLLCPRRTFLASLILASKFFQDKCYSNRAWAKLSGLPPREIGRCEKALGQALEWRLWVGKSTPVTQSSTPTATPNRTVVRSQSESSVLPTPLSSKPFLVQDGSQLITQDLPLGKQASTSCVKTGLRRASTLPNEAFAAQLGIPSPIKATNFDQDQDQNMETIFDDQKQEQPGSTVFANSTSTTSPETPGLTYSPSSTESSSGDHTVQMSTMEDNMFPSADGSQLWLEQVDPRCEAIKSASLVPFEVMSCYDSNTFLLDLARFHSKTRQLSVVQSETGPCSSQYLWHEDRPYIPLEAAGVH